MRRPRLPYDPQDPRAIDYRKSTTGSISYSRLLCSLHLTRPTSMCPSSISDLLSLFLGFPHSLCYYPLHTLFYLCPSLTISCPFGVLVLRICLRGLGPAGSTSFSLSGLYPTARRPPNSSPLQPLSLPTVHPFSSRPSLTFDYSLFARLHFPHPYTLVVIQYLLCR